MLLGAAPGSDENEGGWGIERPARFRLPAGARLLGGPEPPHSKAR